MRINDALNKQFQIVFTSQKEPIKRSDDFFNTFNLQAKKVTMNYVDSTINEINSESSQDFLLEILLKTYKKELAKPLQMIFISYFQRCIFPQILKKRITCPVNEERSRALVINYSAISLTSHVSKIMERKGLTTFLEEIGLLQTHNMASIQEGTG